MDKTKLRRVSNATACVEFFKWRWGSKLIWFPSYCIMHQRHNAWSKCKRMRSWMGTAGRSGLDWVDDDILLRSRTIDYEWHHCLPWSNLRKQSKDSGYRIKRKWVLYVFSHFFYFKLCVQWSDLQTLSFTSSTLPLWRCRTGQMMLYAVQIVKTGLSFRSEHIPQLKKPAKVIVPRC